MKRPAAEIGYIAPDGQRVYYDYSGTRCQGKGYTGAMHDAPWIKTTKRIQFSISRSYNSYSDFLAAI